MAGRIAGITVEINGSTTGLEKSLKSVKSTIKNTQSQLKDPFHLRSRSGWISLKCSVSTKYCLKSWNFGAVISLRM